MDPGTERMGLQVGGLPRTRGDGPSGPRLRRLTSQASPAHAGMDPSESSCSIFSSRLPRTRGDGPCAVYRFFNWPRASPHTRGWTLVVAHVVRPGEGFPAHAGMDPRTARRRKWPTRLPRTRGDGPSTCWWSRVAATASPHTRGWTPCVAPGQGARSGFPAHAGMDPGTRAPGDGAAGLPRTRGDGTPRSLRRRTFAARNGLSAHDLSHVSGRLRRSAGRGRFSAVDEQRAKFGPCGPHGPPETVMRVDLPPLWAAFSPPTPPSARAGA